MRRTRDEMSLLHQALDGLEKDDLRTQKVQPSTSEQSIQAATRVQAINMLRTILTKA